LTSFSSVPWTVPRLKLRWDRICRRDTVHGTEEKDVKEQTCYLKDVGI